MEDIQTINQQRLKAVFSCFLHPVTSDYLVTAQLEDENSRASLTRMSSADWNEQRGECVLVKR